MTMLNLPNDPFAEKEEPVVSKLPKPRNPVMVFLTTATAIAVAVGVGVILVALRDDFVEIIKSLF